MHLQSKHPTSAVGTRKIWHAPLRLLQHATHSQCRDWLVCSGQQKAEAGTLRTSVQKNRRRESPYKRHFRKPSAPSARRSVSRCSWAWRWAQAPRTRDAPRTRTYSHLLPRPRSCARITSPCLGGATGGNVQDKPMPVPAAAWCVRCRFSCPVASCPERSCSIRALLTQPRCRSSRAPNCFGRLGVSCVF